MNQNLRKVKCNIRAGNEPKLYNSQIASYYDKQAIVEFISVFEIAACLPANAGKNLLGHSTVPRSQYLGENFMILIHFILNCTGNSFNFGGHRHLMWENVPWVQLALICFKS